MNELGKPKTECGEQNAPHPGMVWIPGGTFLMGSGKHYPEEVEEWNTGTME